MNIKKVDNSTEHISSKKENPKSKRKRCIITSCILFFLCLLLAFPIFQAIGKAQLLKRIDKFIPGQVIYQNTTYTYNEDIVSFLIMGIDQGRELIDIETFEVDDNGGGQADALFLVVLNRKDNSIKVIGINRNTITDIDVYDDNGIHTNTVKAQINLQHGFGNGLEESCEYQIKAVKNLFYNMPIHGYAAINLSAIMAINDAVGGVDVTVLEDITKRDSSLVKGSQVHLMGESAFWYVKYRDPDIFASADMRLARQKQYLTAFLDTAKHAVSKNPLIALELYKAVKSQVVTDITPAEIAYLTSVLSHYQFDDSSFYTIKGETVMGNIFEEFYVDETALYEMILDLFYEKVPENESL